MPAYQSDLDRKPRGFLQALRSAIKAFRETKGFFSKIRSAFTSLFRSPLKYSEYKTPQMPPTVTMSMPKQPEIKSPHVERKVQAQQAKQFSAEEKVRDEVLGTRQKTVIPFAQKQAQLERQEVNFPPVPTTDFINGQVLPSTSQSNPEMERDILNLKCEDLVTRIGLDKARNFSHSLVRDKFDVDAKPALSAIGKIQALIKTEKNPDELMKKVDAIVNDLEEKKAPKEDSAGQQRRDNYLSGVKELAGEIKSVVKPDNTAKAKMT